MTDKIQHHPRLLLLVLDLAAPLVTSRRASTFIVSAFTNVPLACVRLVGKKDLTKYSYDDITNNNPKVDVSPTYDKKTFTDLAIIMVWPEEYLLDCRLN